MNHLLKHSIFLSFIFLAFAIIWFFLSFVNTAAARIHAHIITETDCTETPIVTPPVDQPITPPNDSPSDEPTPVVETSSSGSSSGGRAGDCRYGYNINTQSCVIPSIPAPTSVRLSDLPYTGYTGE